MRQWTEKERAAIDAVMADVNRLSKHATPQSLEGLVEYWKRFVQEVEKGYEMSIYDYTNDLSTRDILDELMNQLPGTVQAELRAALQVWDDRYRFATVPSSVPVLPGPDVAANPRWWRVPRVLQDELRADFVGEGVILESE